MAIRSALVLPLEVNETMELGWIHPIQKPLSPMAEEYLRYLKEHIIDYGFTIIE